ncbi:MAG: hypothetical protein MUF53_12210 [Gemmatimonadaceae bacterium]|jgi:hypothetical protein|nr:hypothetical protein [Gemmatimonadaceae bacterium]
MTTTDRFSRRPTRGAASLIVVMVMFFIIAMVAAYTSRNLVFEQRTSANQFRATLAFEAAGAGLEWALTRLNDARMGNDCRPLASASAVGVPAEPSFRAAFLGMDPATGVITPVADRLAGCVFDGSDWSCDCPAAGVEPAPAFVANGDGPYTAFWVRFVALPGGRPGVVRIEVNGCTRNDADCLRFNRQAQYGDGLAGLSAVAALRSAPGTAPVAALTVRGSTTVDPAANFTITNDVVGGRGITVHSGSAFAASPVSLRSLPGSPAARSVIDADGSVALPDLVPALSPATPANSGAERMFNSTFGMWATTFAQSPGVVAVACEPCTAAEINDAVLLNPGRAIRAVGAGPLTIDADIGTASDPIVLVADGSIEFGAAPATVHGLVYSRAASWTTGGSGTIRGAAIAEGDLNVVGTLDIVFDGAVLARLRATTGSFVQVPGSWRDSAP